MQIKSSKVLLIIVEKFNETVFSVTDVTSSRPTVLPALTATLIRSLLSRATTIPGHSYTITQDLQTSLAHHIFTSRPAQAWNTTQLQVLGRRGSMEHRTELWLRCCRPTERRPTLGTQTLPRNFLYGSYQCDNTSVENRLQVFFFLNCFKKRKCEFKCNIYSHVEMFVSSTEERTLSWQAIVPLVKLWHSALCRKKEQLHLQDTSLWKKLHETWCGVLHFLRKEEAI